MEKRLATAYGLFIILDQPLVDMILATSNANADKRVEVAVEYEGTIKEFTLDEFFTALGFTP